MECGGNCRHLCGSSECEKCFEKSFASDERAIYWSLDNIFSPWEVFKGTTKNYEFDCDCGHSFEMAPNSVKDWKSWCPYCCEPPKKLCEDESCNDCYGKSFASHPKAKYWSNDNEYTARQVFKHSHKMIKFDCKCGHSFEIDLSAVSGEQNEWCPYCANQKLCDDGKCEICHEKSFASHPMVVFWSGENEYSPREVFKNSDKRIIFDCDCGHIFETQVKNISKDRWCPYCCYPPQKLCDDKKCSLCYKNSFASSIKAKYWSEKNETTPREEFKTSSKKFIFKCRHDHEFCARLDNVKNNKWCPVCKTKTEKKFLEWLKENKYKFDYQVVYEWCKNKRYLPFDFVIEEFKLIIEIDGRQHFQQVSNWADPKYTQEVDLYKMKKAMQNDYTVIRILQEDIWNDKYNWKKKLKRYLHTYDVPQCIFLSQGNEYKCFENKIK